jgi:hypothetical protein
MAFKDSSSDIVISDAGELLHKTFNRLSGTIQSTQTRIVATRGEGFTANSSDEYDDDQFGFSVAAGSGTIVVGAPYEDQQLNSGNQATTGNTGSIYIHRLDGTSRHPLNYNAKISVTHPSRGNDDDDNAGWSVAAGSGRIVVGIPGYNPVNRHFGKVFIYTLDADYVQDLYPDNAGAAYNPTSPTGDYFGTSVAVGSGRIVVGAPLDNGTTNTTDCGSVYIYDLNVNLIQKIDASDPGASDQFGFSVAVGSGRIVIGAPYNDDTASNTGSVYIYDLDGHLVKKIVASDAYTGDQFGRSVAVGSGRIVVGAPFATNQSTGAAYIYDLNGNLIQKIVGSDTAGADNFGTSVAVGSGRIVVGSPYNEYLVATINRGAAYVFDLDGTQLEKLTAGSDDQAQAQFGTSVAVGSGRIVVGAPLEDKDAAMSDSGAVYIYDLDENYDTYIERQLGY